VLIPLAQPAILNGVGRRRSNNVESALLAAFFRHVVLRVFVEGGAGALPIRRAEHPGLRCGGIDGPSAAPAPIQGVNSSITKITLRRRIL